VNGEGKSREGECDERIMDQLRKFAEKNNSMKVMPYIIKVVERVV